MPEKERIGLVGQNGTAQKEEHMAHQIHITDRNTMSVSGVKDVDAYNESMISAITTAGELTIEGENLHIVSLTLQSGEMNVTGKITGLFYLDNEPKKQSGGFFGRLMR